MHGAMCTLGLSKTTFFLANFFIDNRNRYMFLTKPSTKRTREPVLRNNDFETLAAKRPIIVQKPVESTLSMYNERGEDVSCSVPMCALLPVFQFSYSNGVLLALDPSHGQFIFN